MHLIYLNTNTFKIGVLTLNSSLISYSIEISFHNYIWIQVKVNMFL